MSTINKRNFLYHLIDSLSATEKRYFKIISNQHVIGKVNNYILLFDLINAQKDEDPSRRESIVKSHFIQITKKKRYDLYKANLYKKILDALEVYHRDKDITSEIKSAISHILILRTKDLPNQVNQLIKKTKNKCIKHEKWGLLLELVDLEREFNYTHQKPSLDNNEERQIIDKLTNVCDYRSLQSEMWKIFIENGLPTNNTAIKRYDAVGLKKLIQNESSALTLESRFIRLYLLQFYMGMKMQLNETCKYGEALVLLLENNPHLKVEKAVLYIRSLVNLQYAYIRQKKLDKVLGGIDKCKMGIKNLNVPPAFEYTIQLSLFINEYDVRQLINKNIDQLPLLQKMNLYVENNMSSLAKPGLYLYYWQNVLYHFTHKNYEKCLDWLYEINNERSDIRHDIQALSSMLMLIVYYELDNRILLRYASINAYRSLLKKKHLDRLEKTLLIFLKAELSKVNRTKKQRTKSFVKLRKDLDYINQHEQSHEALKMGMVYDWVDGQIK